MRLFSLILVCIVLTVPLCAGSSLEAGLTDWLVRQYALDTAHARISLVHSDLATADLSAFDMKVVPLVLSEPKGRFPVRVELYQNGALSAKGSATLEIRKLADLLVPTRGIKRTEPLLPDQFVTKRLDVTGLTDDFLADPSQLAGCRAKTDLAADKQVPISRVDKIPDVENGYPVTIVASDGQLEIRTRGVALQNGRIGEMIQVRNVESKKIVVGRITSAGTITISI
jgi:flagella basal body P-ring formation protein FlgA